jgi:hypothetical protein
MAKIETVRGSVDSFAFGARLQLRADRKIRKKKHQTTGLVRPPPPQRYKIRGHGAAGLSPNPPLLLSQLRPNWTARGRSKRAREKKGKYK